MESEVLKTGVQYGIFAVLFIYLLFYVLKTTGEREVKYQETIKENQSIIKKLTEKFDIVTDIKREVEEIKECIKK